MNTEQHKAGFFGSLLSACVRHWGMALAASLALLAAGAFSFLHLPIDAVPDITNVQVQINAEAPGFTPQEVEKRVTLPLETQLAGIPGLQSTRSLSRYGLSQITAVFDEGTDIYFARAQIGERLVEAREALPDGVGTSMGPISTGLGEVFFYTLEPDTLAPKPITDPGELKTIHDWVVKPQLRRLPGVAAKAPGRATMPYQAVSPLGPTNRPDTASSPSSANFTGIRAPSSGVMNPVWPVRSVLT